MLAARLGKSAGLQTRHGSPMNLTKRTELRRIPDRGSHDWGTINQILDAGFLAHVGFCVDGQPFVIPTLYGRDGEKLYLHGSAARRTLRELETGIPACVTVPKNVSMVLLRPTRRGTCGRQVTHIDCVDAGGGYDEDCENDKKDALHGALRKFDRFSAAPPIARARLSFATLCANTLLI